MSRRTQIRLQFDWRTSKDLLKTSQTHPWPRKSRARTPESGRISSVTGQGAGRVPQVGSCERSIAGPRTAPERSRRWPVPPVAPRLGRRGSPSRLSRTRRSELSVAMACFLVRSSGHDAQSSARMRRPLCNASSNTGSSLKRPASSSHHGRLGSAEREIFPSSRWDHLFQGFQAISQLRDCHWLVSSLLSRAVRVDVLLQRRPFAAISASAGLLTRSLDGVVDIRANAPAIPRPSG